MQKTKTSLSISAPNLVAIGGERRGIRLGCFNRNIRSLERTSKVLYSWAGGMMT